MLLLFQKIVVPLQRKPIKKYNNESINLSPYIHGETTANTTGRSPETKGNERWFQRKGHPDHSEP